MRIPSILSVTVWVWVPVAARAQLVTEEISLQSGWNAVWVNLDPEPDNLEQILAQQSPPLDFQAIWTFDANREVSDPSLGPSPGRWLFHDRDVPPALTTLRTLQGHRAYLIDMRSAGRLRLEGRPLIRSTHFTSQVSNLFGALSDPTSNPLTFEEFFSHPDAAGKVRTSSSPIKHDIFALVGGALQRRTISDPIQPNTAYWLNVVQDLDYVGPLDASANINGLSFGRTTALQSLVLEVSSSQSTRSVRLQARPCAVLSTDGQCSGAEEAARWLEYRDATQAGVPVWHSLADGLDVVVPAGGTRIEVELRARRSGLESAARSSNTAGATSTFPLVIDVSDQQGSRSVIASDVTVEPIFGRWIGRATLTQVSAHPTIQELPLEQAEATPLTMTLLLDLPDSSSGAAVPRLLDSVSVPAFRDGRAVTRTFNSILFDRPVSLTVDASDALDPFGASGTLRGALRILPDDPLNPYRHRYNPEHRKGYDITREFTIKIENQADSLADELSGLDGTFGPHRLTGQYTEVITGISAQPITVRGNFRLERLGQDAGSQ
jgi:hypothetical protein